MLRTESRRALDDDSLVAWLQEGDAGNMQCQVLVIWTMAEGTPETRRGIQRAIVAVA